jgi:hypothetical protein
MALSSAWSAMVHSLSENCAIKGPWQHETESTMTPGLGSTLPATRLREP